MARGGKEGGRGRGRGQRGRGGPTGKFGERIILNSADSGYAPPTATGRSAARFRPVVTGTEEILSSFPDQEVDAIKEKKIEDSKAPSSSSEDEDLGDIDMDDVPVSQVEKVRHRPGYFFKKEKELEENGYKLLWTQALSNKQTKTKPNMLPNKEKVAVVHPIPRYQPAGYLNKFAKKKITPEEPKFDRVGERLQMTFAQNTESEDPQGMVFCSRAAGEVWKRIFEMPHLFRSVICLQLPNSLKALTNKGEFKDIRVGDQNVVQGDDVEVGGQRKQKPRYHCMKNFNANEPFGKIQMLKSGRVILRIGDRKFDVCTTSKSFDPDVGIIMEFTDNEPRSARNGSGEYDEKIHSLGMIKHHFSAYYNYEEVFNAADNTVTDRIYTAKTKIPVEI